MTRNTIVEDQEGRPLISIGEPGAVIAGRYPRETPRETGELLYDYIWVEHGFRQQTANDRCWTCDWPPCAPWHTSVPAPAIGPLRALVFGIVSAFAGALLAFVWLGGSL